MLEAVAVVSVRFGRGGGRGWRHAEQAAAQGQLLGAVAAGEEAEVSDAVEVGRQDVQQEAADELLGGERHRLALVAMAVIGPVEADAAVVEGEEAVVGDGDPLGLAQGREVAVAGGGVLYPRLFQ